MEWIWILYALVILFILQVIWNMKYKHTYEGFTTEKRPDKSHEKIVSKNSEIKDKLNIKTYKSNYEDIILELDHWCDVSMMEILSKGTIGTTDLSKSIEDIKMYNDLHSFKTNINQSMKFIDSH